MTVVDELARRKRRRHELGAVDDRIEALLEHADHVLVLDQGRLVEQGTHAQLLAAGGLYSHLHRMQFRDEAGP